MSAPTRWWWLRHGPVTAPKGLVVGRLDLPCVCAPEATRALAAELPRDAVLVESGARRCRETAAALAEAGLRLPEPEIVPGLWEQDFGRWQGRCWDELPQAAAEADLAALTPPEGESFAAMIPRVEAAIRAVTARWPGRDILAVAHAGTIRAALAVALDLSPRAALSFHLAPLSLTRIDAFGQAGGGEWQAEGWGVALVNRVMAAASLPPAFPALVLGGARSGKSAYAEGLLAGESPRVYVATARRGPASDADMPDPEMPDPEMPDPEMTERIRLHRERRGDDWTTIEEPLDLAGALEGAARPGVAVLVDCLTVWLGNLMFAGRDVAAETERLAALLPRLPGRVVLVSSEVGLGIVPDNALARSFRDHAGRLQQAVAAVSASVVQVTAGLPQRLK